MEGCAGCRALKHRCSAFWENACSLAALPHQAAECPPCRSGVAVGPGARPVRRFLAQSVLRGQGLAVLRCAGPSIWDREVG